MSDTVSKACLPSCEEPTISSPSLHSSRVFGKKGADRYGVFEDTKPSSTMKVVLDLDECLVHSRLATAEDGYSGVGFVLETDGPRPEKVHVTLRPYLVEFLIEVMSRYDVYIFTAGQEHYASPLLDILEFAGEKGFTHRFYPKDLTYHEGLGSNVKDLRAAFTRNGFEYDPRQVVLIDNLTQNFALNPSNGIPIVDFVGDQTDSALMDLIPFLRELEKFEDVRPVLDRMFAVRQHFVQYEVLLEENEDVEEDDGNVEEEDVVMDDAFDFEEEGVVVVDVVDVNLDITFDFEGDVVMEDAFEDIEGGDTDLLVGLDFVADESDTSSLVYSEFDDSLLFDEEGDDDLSTIFNWEVDKDSSFEVVEVVDVVEDDVNEEIVVEAEVEVENVDEVVEAVQLRRSPRLRNIPRVDYKKFF